MRLKRFLLLCLVVFVPALVQGSVFHLKDGSAIQGKLLKLVNDTLYVETSFGAKIRIPKSQIVRVDFADSAAVLPMPSTAVPKQSSVPGTVMVSFEKFNVSSRVTVHRGQNEAEILKANSIELAFYVGSEKVYSVIDSSTNKEIREGPDTVYKNEMRPEEFKVAVPPGSYQCRLFLRNTFARDYENSFVNDPLEKRLLVENVNVLPAQTTLYRVGLKRKMKLGSPQLFVYQ